MSIDDRTAKRRDNMAASVWGPRRASRTSARQFEVLLDYIEAHPCMVNSRLPSSFGERERHWQNLTRMLNAHPVSFPKAKDKWKKTWFDWKCNVRSKARSNGTKNLTPLEKRLIRLTGLMDGEENGQQSKSSKSEIITVRAGTKQETEDQLCIDWSGSRSQGSNATSPSADAMYGESREEYIVPTPEGPTPSDIAIPDRIIVLSDVRSLADPTSPRHIKEEIIDEDDEVVSVEFQPQLTVQERPCSTDRTVEDTTRRPGHHPSSSDVLSPTAEHPRGNPPPPSPPLSSSTSILEKKTRLEVEVLLATKRKLEAEERRADAEAEFFHEEKRRSTSLIALHEEELRKTAALADFHREERRKAHAKAELLLEHRRFYVEQQKTEVLRRKLLALELRKARQQLKTVD